MRPDALQPQTQPATRTATESEFSKLINQPTKGIVKYMPFGGSDPITLTVSMVQNLIAVKTRKGKTCSEADAIKFLAMCQARRLNPLEGDAYMIGYDNRDEPDNPTFSLITAIQAFLKRAENNPEYDGMESGVIIQNTESGEIVDVQGDFYSDGWKPLGGWAKVHFKSRKIPTLKRLALGTFSKGFGQWQSNPAGMICKCAEADALRSSFPTMLGGLYSGEELGELLNQKFELAKGGQNEPTQPRQNAQTPPKAESPTGNAAPEAPIRGQDNPQERKSNPSAKPESGPSDLEKFTNAVDTAGISAEIAGKVLVELGFLEEVPSGLSVGQIASKLTPHVVSNLLKNFTGFAAQCNERIEGESGLAPAPANVVTMPPAETAKPAPAEDSDLDLLRRKLSAGGILEDQLIRNLTEAKKVLAGTENLEAVAEMNPALIKWCVVNFEKLKSSIQSKAKK